MKRRSEETDEGRIHSWLAAGPQEQLATFWPSSDGDRSVEAFTTSILRHLRVHPSEALAAIDRISPKERRSLSRREQLQVTRLRAHALFSLSRMEESRREYERSWRGFEKLGLDEELVFSGIGFISVLGHLGHYESARRIATLTEKRIPRGRPLLRARLLSNQGNLHFWVSRYDRAAACYRRARRVFLHEEYELDAALASYNLGHTLIYLARCGEARCLLESAGLTFERAGRDIQSAYVRYALAVLDMVQGRWEGMGARLRQLRTELEVLGDPRAFAALLQEQAGFLMGLGALGPAEEAARLSHRSYRQLGLMRESAQTAFLQGRILRQMGRRIDARVRLHEARELFEQHGDSLAVRRVQIDLASLHLLQGEMSVALPMLRDSIHYLRRKAPAGIWVEARGLLAQVHLDAGRPGRASRIAASAYRSASSSFVFDALPWIALVRSQALLRLGHPDQARRWLSRAVEDHERLQGLAAAQPAIMGETEGLKQFRQAVLGFLDDGKIVRTEEWALRLMSRLHPFHGVGSSRRSTVSDRNDAQQITKLRDQLLNLSDSRQRAHRYRALEQQLQDSSERWRSQLRTRGATDHGRKAFRRWRKLLGRRTLVYYFQQGESWHAYVVRAEGRIRRVDLLGASLALEKRWIPLRMLLEQAAHLPRAQRGRFLEDTEGEAIGALSELRATLWDPLELSPGPVLVVPEGPLNGLPVESLPLAGDDLGRERFTISRLPHPLFLRRRSRRRDGSILILHDGNPGPRREAQLLQRLLRDRKRPVRVMSRRRALTQQAGPLSVLHVAAHGIYHREKWLLNGIRLGDGWLGLEQLHTTALRGALLFFSSCDSGLSFNAPGAELGGWAAEGLRAGAGAMVLSLWKIPDDAAMAFAQSFYRSWRQGLDVTDAALRARIQLRERQRHPFTWASFLNVG